VQIKEGGYYKTRDSRKVGPMTKEGNGFKYGNFSWWPSGSAAIGTKNPGDLIEEWTE